MILRQMSKGKDIFVAGKICKEECTHLAAGERNVLAGNSRVVKCLESAPVLKRFKIWGKKFGRTHSFSKAIPYMGKLLIYVLYCCNWLQLKRVS